MSEENSNDEVIKLESFYIVASAKEKMHYIFGIAELHEAPTLSVGFVLYNPETNNLEYRYDYGLNPEIGSTIKPYLLSVFSPYSTDERESYVDPNEMWIANERDKTKKKSTTIATTNPIILPEFPQAETEVEVDKPRVAKIRINVQQADGSSDAYDLIFIIAKTTSINYQSLNYSINGSTIECSYNYKGENSNAQPMAASTALIGTADQFNKVTLNGQSTPSSEWHNYNENQVGI